MDIMNLGIEEEEEDYITIDEPDTIQSEDNTSTVAPEEVVVEEPSYEPNHDVIKPTLKYMLENGKTLNELKTEKPEIYASMIDANSRNPDDEFIHMLAQKNRDHYDDPKQADEALQLQLKGLGYNMEELHDRASMGKRFQGGLAHSLTEAYSGITGAEEGDTAYEMEKISGEDTKADSKLYEALNTEYEVEYSFNPFDGKKMVERTGGLDVGTDMATTVGAEAPTVVATMGAGMAAGAVAKGVGAGAKALSTATVAGEIAGDVAYTGARAMSEQSDMGAGDVAMAVGAGVIGSKISGLFTPTEARNFTTIAEMPKKQRKAVEVMRKEADLSVEEMEDHIRSYAKTTIEGDVTTLKAVEGASKASDAEPVGYMIEAMKRDPEVKAKAIRESTQRSNVAGEALGRMSDELDDPAFRNAYNRRTIDDEGRRKATNWAGLQKDLATLGVPEDDAIYKIVAENASALGQKETDIFQATVKAVKPEDKAAAFIEPFVNTQRASLRSQSNQGWIEKVGSVVRHYFPNEDMATVRTIQDAIKEGSSVKQIEKALLDEGIETTKATRMAQEMAEAMEQDRMDDIVRQTSQAKETQKELVEDVADWASERKIPSDLGKKLTRAKQKGDVDAVEAIKKEIDAKIASDEKSVMKAGINKQTEVDNKAREVSIAKKKATADKAEAKKKTDADKREADYAKQADEEADRLAKVAKDEASAKKKADAEAKTAKEAEQKAEREATVEAFKESEAILAGGKAPEKFYSKKYEDAVMSDNPAKAKEWKQKLDDFRASKQAKADEESVIVPKPFKETKPMSQNKKDKIIQKESGTTGRSDIDINREAKDGQQPMDNTDLDPSKATDAEKSGNAKARASKARELEASDDATIMENALRGELREDHRDGLNMAINHPDSTPNDVLKAERRLTQLDVQKAEPKKKSKNTSSQSQSRKDTINELGMKDLQDFEADYTKSGISGEWAREARKHSNKLARDAEKAPTEQMREVMLNKKKDFDESLRTYYEEVGSISGDMKAHLEGKQVVEGKKKVKPKKPVEGDATYTGSMRRAKGTRDRLLKAKDILDESDYNEVVKHSNIAKEFAKLVNNGKLSRDKARELYKGIDIPHDLAKAL